MFGLLGKAVSRGWWFWLLLWIIVAIWLTHVAPPLEKVTTEGPGVALPPGFDSREAGDLLAEAFSQESSRLIVLFSSERPLTPADDNLISLAIDNITTVATAQGRRERHPIVSFLLNPYDRSYLKPRMTSTDNTTVMVAVALKSQFVDMKTHGYIDGVVKHLDGFVKQHPHLSYNITDSAAIGRDYEIQADRSLKRTRIATVVLVVTILILVYRSIFAPILTLLTVVLSLHIATCVMAIVGQRWMEVPKLVPVYMLVIMYGAVTDYCMFIIGRFREELARGHSRFEAVRIAVQQVGGATAASASTTIAGLLMMFFAEFEIFRSTGPVLGVGLAVGLLASLTFTPSLVVLFGRHLFWPKREITLVDIEHTASGRFWGRFANMVIRRPGLVLVVALLFFLPFAALGGSVHPAYDLFSELPADAPSVIGNAVVNARYPKTARSENIVVVLQATPRAAEADNTPGVPALPPPLAKRYFESHDGLAEIDAITEAILRYSSDAIEVRSMTRPLGKSEPVIQEYLRTNSALVGIKFRLAFGLAFPQYVSSKDGTITRIAVVLDESPFSIKSVKMAENVRTLVQDIINRDKLSDQVKVRVGGVSAQMLDISKITRKDLRRLRWMVLGVLYIILAIMLRGGIAPIYLLLTMVLNYFATVGIIQIVFVNFMGMEGLDWKVEFFLFVLLVAIGVDYNIYIMSRLREETKRRPFRQALYHAIVFTGSIISSCGIIMAGTFASMTRSTLSVMVQLGMAMALGVLLDTFIVRPLVVPALALLVEKVKERFRGVRGPGG